MVAMIVTWIETEGGTNVDKSHSADIGLAETWPAPSINKYVTVHNIIISCK